MSETRNPTQKRSIEKKNRIIEKGFYLMCNHGYYNVSTADIASFAGVSTGIVYQYFKDKKEIFIEGVKSYADHIMYPMIHVLETEKSEKSNYHLELLIKNMIDQFIEIHTISKKAHQELMAMSQLDNEISEIFKNSELKMTEKIVSLLENNKIHIENAKEKVHIAYGLMDNLCHEIVYHKHKNLDYDRMKNEVVNIIVHMLH